MAQKLKYLFLILMLLGGAACATGTETGNPGNTEAPGSDGPGDAGAGDPCALRQQALQTQATDEETALDEIIETICLKIFVCDVTISRDDCTDALNGADGDEILDELGLTEGLFTVEQVHSLLQAGSITADTTAQSACEEDIADILCPDVLADVSLDDFTNVENIIPDSCNDVLNANTEAIADACQ